MTTKEARVEVLTAEVRALMVGSRQVTLSVFRQLDTRPFDEVIPFGRVRDGNSTYSHELVGQSKIDGSLVKTHVMLATPLTEYEQNCLIHLRCKTYFGAITWGKTKEEMKAFLEAKENRWLALNELREEQMNIYNSYPLIVLAGLK